MKYKVGEKIKVKTWDEMTKVGKIDKDGDIGMPDGPFFVRTMKKFCGKEVTISRIISEGLFTWGGYEIEEDDREYTWTDSMFEEKTEISPKYKVGDKVKIREDLIEGTEYGNDVFVKGMKAYLGKTAEIAIASSKVGRYHLKIDGKHIWYNWTDEMLEPVAKFKVGDSVIGNKKANCYCWTHEGWTGKVIRVYGNGRIRVEDDCGCYFDVAEDKFDLVETCNKKVVITADGTTTLARLYEDGKVIRSAEAKCSADDKFDFEFGAKLACDRLFKTIQDTKKKLWSGKVICIDKCGYDFYTTGKIYEVKNGGFEDDFGGPSFGELTCFDDLKKQSRAKWFEVVE